MKRRIFVFLVVLWMSIAAAAAEPSRTLAVADAGPVTVRQVDACSDGTVLDDGTFESGYGWVPSAIWGEYVQRFPAGAVNIMRLERLCVALTRTRDDDSLDFEVVVYRQEGATPGGGGSFRFPASATAVPAFPEFALYEVDLGAAAPTLTAATTNIGIRWNPSVDQFFFVGADQDGPPEPLAGYYRDDRAEGQWGDVLMTSDPIFDDHGAMGIRIVTGPGAWLPDLGVVGRGVLILALAAAAWIVLRGRTGP